MLKTNKELALHAIGKQAEELGLLVESDIWHDYFYGFVDAGGRGHDCYFDHHLTRVDVYADNPVDVETAMQLLKSDELRNLGIFPRKIYHSTANGTLDGIRFS